MCTNFDNIAERLQLKKYFGVSILPNKNIQKTNIRPKDESLIINAQGHCTLMTWGFDVDWMKKPLINARAETLLQKSSFHEARNNRCLVPASCWYEWRKEATARHKNRISIKSVDAFAMAAISMNGQFCILTCVPHPQIANIHERMPVLIAPHDYTRWLNTDIRTAELCPLMDTPQNIAFDWVEEEGAQKQFSLF